MRFVCSILILVVVTSAWRVILNGVCHLFIFFFIDLSLLVVDIASQESCYILDVYEFFIFLYLDMEESTHFGMMMKKWLRWLTGPLFRYLRLLCAMDPHKFYILEGCSSDMTNLLDNLIIIIIF